MKCPRCGKKTLFDVAKCSKCGNDFTVYVASPTPESSVSEEPVPSEEQNVNWVANASLFLSIVGPLGVVASDFSAQLSGLREVSVLMSGVTAILRLGGIVAIVFAIIFGMRGIRAARDSAAKGRAIAGLSIGLLSMLLFLLIVGGWF